MNRHRNTYRLFNLGHVKHNVEGTDDIPALSNLNISKALVPFRFGNVDSSLASERILLKKP